MRSLLTDAPAPVLAVATSPRLGAETDWVPEMHMAIRPSLGRLENTRAHKALGVLDIAMLEPLSRRLTRLGEGQDDTSPRVRASAFHTIPHSVDFVAVQRAADRLGLPMFVSLHDDPSYALRERVERAYALRHLGAAWLGARERFVISEEMGLEMCNRYGERSYVVVTDGLDTIRSLPRTVTPGRLSVYFMGAAHIPYDENFQCLVAALEQMRDRGVDARLVTRAGRFPFRLESRTLPIEHRPWARQSDVERDFDDIDLAYMPLPFGAEHVDFVRCSLSTKMVTYLGSGVPVLFHGPKQSAAGKLLRQAGAGFEADSLDARALCEILAFDRDRGITVVENALRLARSRFRLADIRTRFWAPILAAEDGRADQHV
jgi:hypothetical protein